MRYQSVEKRLQPRQNKISTGENLIFS